MRHLLLLLAFFCASSFVSAQCDLTVNFLSSECIEGSNSFIATFTVESSTEGSWFAPQLQLEGDFNTGDVFSTGPLPASFIGTSINFFSQGVDSCFVTVPLPEVTCDDVCFGLSLFAEVETLDCGPTGGQIIITSVTANNFPVILEVLDESGNTFFSDSIFTNTTTDYFVPGQGIYIVRATDSEGCLVEQLVEPTLFSCASLEGLSWLDTNGNGLQDEGEDEVVQATVFLRRDNGGVIGTSHTDQNGVFTFSIWEVDVAYELEVIPDDSLRGLTILTQGNECIDNDFNAATGRTEIFVPAPGTVETCIDAGWIGDSDVCSQVGFEVWNNFPDEPCSLGIPTVFVSGANADFPIAVSIIDQATGEVESEQELDETTTLTFPDLPGLSYTVELSTARGCTINSEFGTQQLSPIPVSIVQVGTPCSDQGVSLIAEVAVDPTDFTYLWSTGETTPVIEDVDVNSVYFVQVFSGDSCNGFAQIIVNDNGTQNDTIDVDPLYTLGCDSGTVTMTINTPVDGVVYTWFGPQNTVLTGVSVETELPGFYEVRGEMGTNCFSFGFTQVLDLSLGELSLQSFGSDTICGEGACFTIEGLDVFNTNSPIEIIWDGPPSFDEWFATQTFPIQGICGFEEGLYTVTVQTACDTIVMTYDATSSQCSEISGTLYLDSDGDCDLDDEDTPAPGFVLTLTNDDTGEMYYAWTGQDGTWSILVPDGTYTVTPIIEDGQPLSTCDPATSVTLAGQAVSGVNVFMPVLFDCPVLTTEVTIPFLRRCFQGCAYVNYENSGTATGEDAQVVVVLDPYFIDVVPSIDPVSVEGNVYTFNLGDLPPFSDGTIGFIFTISCEAELGQSHCIDAAITPDDPCHDDENWNGALVEITSAECLDDSLVFTVTNIGDNQMSVPLNYIIVEDGIMLSPEPITNGQLTPEEDYFITVPANGSTYAVITNQEPNAPGTEQPTVVFEGCTGGGQTFTTGFSNLLPLASGNPARSIVCRENVGSYDPNDKRGYPLGWDGGNIEEGTRLDYEIRFQNTGTDTAFTVVISDTISTALDLATFKMEAASHDYTVTIDTHRVVTWTFNNIMLPDSNTNLLLSQGSVVFSIDHDDSLVPGDEITNEAAIYFDFNEPIITNESLHIIAKDGLPVSTRSIAAQSLHFSVYPNPTNGMIKLNAPEGEFKGSEVLQVTDMFGRPLMSVPYQQLGQGLNVGTLPPGYYLLLVNDASGITRGRTAFVVSGK